MTNTAQASSQACWRSSRRASGHDSTSRTWQAAVLVLGLVSGCLDASPVEAPQTSSDESPILIVPKTQCESCVPSDSCSVSCTEQNGDVSTCGRAGPTCASARVNVAAASSGASVSVSSLVSSRYPASAVINGERGGYLFGINGGWIDQTYGVYPDWVEVTFAGARPRVISEVDVYMLTTSCGDQPNATNCQPPTSGETTVYGLTDFSLQYWNGSSFVNVPNGQVTANDLALRTLEISPPLVTSKIRLWITAASGGRSRVVELEAWEDGNALDSDPQRAIDARIAMTPWLTNCDSLVTARTINDETGYYKHCDNNWVVWSPENGAWILPKSYISDRYLGGSSWPATPTAMTRAMGFPKGAYHGAETTSNYLVFERGILAKSKADTVPRRIGGLDATTANGPAWPALNEALSKAWLEASFPGKYPVSDTRVFSCTSSRCGGTLFGNWGFLFNTEANASGSSSTFMIKYGATEAMHLDGQIEDKWWSATVAEKLALGWPIANERVFNTAGHKIAQFEGGAILWQPTTGCSGSFEAKIVTGPTGGSTPRYTGNLTGVSCPSSPTVVACVDGAKQPFTAPDITNATWQLVCSSNIGWPDTLVMRWYDSLGLYVERHVAEPILSKYLNSDPLGGTGNKLRVEEAVTFTPGDVSTGMGLPLGFAFDAGSELHQLFQNGTITDVQQCADACTTKVSCARPCYDGSTLSRCEHYRPAPYVHGKCQLFDVYCEMPEIMDGSVIDDNESGAGGPNAFFYYRHPDGDAQGLHEKRGRMPVQLGGKEGAPASNYFTLWQQVWSGITDSQFPFASNFFGNVAIRESHLQWEIGDTHSTPLPVKKHPALIGRQCTYVAQTTYGISPPPPTTFPASTRHQINEDDDCFEIATGERRASCDGSPTCVCNPNDPVAMIRLYHGRCTSQGIWNGGQDFGWTTPYTITRSSGGSPADISGEDVGIDWLQVRDYCYRGRNLPIVMYDRLQTPEYGIGTVEHPGYELP